MNEIGVYYYVAVLDKKYLHTCNFQYRFKNDNYEYIGFCNILLDLNFQAQSLEHFACHIALVHKPQLACIHCLG